jgi:Flp pilus assembly protein TadD
LAEAATAAEDWPRAAELWYGLHRSETPKTERTYVQAARALHMTGDTEGACALIRRGLMDFPNDPQLYELHAVILEACGFHRLAESTYLRLVEIVPDHLAGLIGLGRVRMHLGDERSAAAPLRRAALLAPQRVEPCRHLARVHQVCGDPQGAFDWSTRAIELGADDPQFLLDAAVLAADEQVLVVQPDAREQALVWIERILRVDPQVTLAHFLKGAHLQTLGRTDEALVSYLRAAETDPGCLPALARLARLYALEGDVTRTREFVERALQLEEDPTRRLALAELLQGQPPDDY